MKSKRAQTLPRTIFGYQVTAHAQERFRRRFKGHDLEQAIKRATAISGKMARKLTFDVPLTFTAEEFFLYDETSQAVFILREHKSVPDLFAIITVVKTAWGKWT